MVKISDELQKGLFKSAYQAKERGENLDKVFEDFAVKTGRAKGSVRNFYYSTLKRAETSCETQAKYLGDMRLRANKIVGFEDGEVDDLLEKVLLGVTSGKSVRRVILEISPDGKTALRNQNKYRNLLRFNKDKVEKVRQKIISNHGKCADPFFKKRAQGASLTLLKKEINDLCERIGQSLKRENQALKAQIEILKEQNARLKENLVGADGEVLKDYFSSPRFTAEKRD